MILLYLIGWSRYSVEGIVSCSIEWKERSLTVTSYNIAIILGLYVVPGSVLIVTNIKLIKAVMTSFKSIVEECFKIYMINVFLLNIF